VQPSGILREDREMLSVKEDNNIIKEFTEAVWAKGNSYVDYFILFDKQNEKCFDYKLIGRMEEPNAYVIEIKQKEIDIGKKRWLRCFGQFPIGIKCNPAWFWRNPLALRP
jgi:hypothetical protein